MELFLTPSLSKTEEDLLFETFKNPVVVKYLRILALEDTKELVSLSAISKTNEDLAKAHATVNGKLSVIQTLLSIAEANQGESK